MRGYFHHKISLKNEGGNGGEKYNHNEEVKYSHTMSYKRIGPVPSLKEASKTGQKDRDTNLFVISDIKPSPSFTLTSREVFNPHKTRGEFTQLKVNEFSPLKFGENGGYSTPQ